MRFGGSILTLMMAGSLQWPVAAQSYDFSAVEALLPPDRITNLYGGDVILLLERGGDEIYRFEYGDLTACNDLAILQAIRDEVDRAGPPLPPPATPLTIDLFNGHPRLQWVTNGVLECSDNLLDWTAMPWARSPFHEVAGGTNATQRFYRLQT